MYACTWHVHVHAYIPHFVCMVLVHPHPQLWLLCSLQFSPATPRKSADAWNPHISGGVGITACLVVQSSSYWIGVSSWALARLPIEWVMNDVYIHVHNVQVVRNILLLLVIYLLYVVLFPYSQSGTGWQFVSLQEYQVLRYCTTCIVNTVLHVRVHVCVGGCVQSVCIFHVLASFFMKFEISAGHLHVS